MGYNQDVLESEGKRVVLLGNEAIARGALEAGVGVSACYPGTPSSEIGMTLSSVAKRQGLYFEWSTNEKVAFETCAGACYSGVRALTAMKHFGFNVASDSILPVAFTGVRGGLVLVVADDPLGHSSAQSEQDTRYYQRMGKIPALEPANAQEAKDLTKKAFEISERFELPVILRTTTLVNHSIGSVKLGRIPKPRRAGFFKKDFERFYSVRPNLQAMHKKLLKKLQAIEKGYGSLNTITGNGRVGIIASGVSRQYVRELGRLNGVRMAELVLTNPIPRDFIMKFLKGLKTVLVVEELEPIVESFVREVAKDVNPGVRIHGKDIMPRIGEYNPDIVREALAPFVGVPRRDFRRQDMLLKKMKLPTRRPVLCQGCPHRSTFYAVKKALGENVVWAGDIGCYVLGIFEPFKMQDYFLSMGASLGVTHGINMVSKQKTVVFIGDSTFFHAGMAGLVNMVYNDPKALVIVMDNEITAMTGHQPHPGTGRTGMGDSVNPISIEAVVRSLGIENVRTVNAFNQKELQAAVREFDRSGKLSVIISKGMCRLLHKRVLRAQGQAFPVFQVNPAKARGLWKTLKNFSCPAFVKKGDKVFIKEGMCWGCSVCSQITPPGTITAKPRRKK